MQGGHPWSSQPNTHLPSSSSAARAQVGLFSCGPCSLPGRKSFPALSPATGDFRTAALGELAPELPLPLPEQNDRAGSSHSAFETEVCSLSLPGVAPGQLKRIRARSTCRGRRRCRIRRASGTDSGSHRLRLCRAGSGPVPPRRMRTASSSPSSLFQVRTGMAVPRFAFQAGQAARAGGIIVGRFVPGTGNRAVQPGSAEGPVAQKPPRAWSNCTSPPGRDVSNRPR